MAQQIILVKVTGNRACDYESSIRLNIFLKKQFRGS